MFNQQTTVSVLTSLVLAAIEKIGNRKIQNHWKQKYTKISEIQPGTNISKLVPDPAKETYELHRIKKKTWEKKKNKQKKPSEK